ncbi:MAG TPA: sensor histidine kinase, partial [Actinomycetota bacterium]|nr:sensor histidine kinase [Actinomycetota bacterium]
VFAAVGARGPLFIAIILGTITYEIHVLFVAIAERTSRGTPWRSIAKTLLPPGLAGTAVYLALGFLGIVFALAFERIGAWAVVTLLIPLLITRHALRISRQLEQAEHDRRALADRLIDERERERTRIASQIHDGVLQQLAALQLQSDNMRSAVKVNDLLAAERIATETTAGLRRSIDDLRSSIRNLRRVSMDDGGLVPTLSKFARSFHAETGIPVEVQSSSGDLDIPLPVGLLLYECCQEALTNVARHARASKVRVNLGRVGGSVQLHVVDDGVGGVKAISTNGLGLSLMKDKVALAGGGMWVESKNEHGTEVTISVPIGSS